MHSLKCIWIWHLQNRPHLLNELIGGLELDDKSLSKLMMSMITVANRGQHIDVWEPQWNKLNIYGIVNRLLYTALWISSSLRMSRTWRILSYVIKHMWQCDVKSSNGDDWKLTVHWNFNKLHIHGCHKLINKLGFDSWMTLRYSIYNVYGNIATHKCGDFYRTIIKPSTFIRFSCTSFCFQYSSYNAFTAYVPSAVSATRLRLAHCIKP